MDAPEEKALEGTKVLEGSWEFSLNVHTVDAVCFEVNKEYQAAGCNVMVKAVELIPISVKLICDESSARKLAN